MSDQQSSWFALRYPNFRAMFVAQFILQIGAAMQIAAINWQVWRLTQDELALGFVGLARVIPIILFALLGGVIADAMDRRRLLFGAHALQFILYSVLALGALSGTASIWLIYSITSMLAGVTAFESPARVALLPTLVPRAHLAHASRINTIMFPITGVLGPLLAAAIIALGGAGASYVLCAVSAIPAMIVVGRLKVLSNSGSGRRDINLSALKEGLTFVWRTPELRAAMLLDFFATFFSSALALLPIYADQILKVGVEGYGVLSAAPALGSIIGAGMMAHIGSRLKHQGKIMLVSVAAYGLFTVIFGLSNTFLLSLVMLAGTGFADAVSMTIRGTMRQLLTPDRLRGRMISVNMIFYMGGPQLGEFEAGFVARAVSTPFSVISGGIGTLIVVALTALTVPALARYEESEVSERLANAPIPEPIKAEPSPHIVD
ncbi:MAG: MFS transporter [Anaerolineae bacterium]